MSLSYFTHLYESNSLAVKSELSTPVYYFNTTIPTRIIIKSDYSRMLFASDVETVDSNIALNTTKSGSLTVEDTVPVTTGSIGTSNVNYKERLITNTSLTVDNTVKISDDLSFILPVARRYYVNGVYRPIIPDGYSTASFYQNNTLVAEVQSRIMPALTPNSQHTNLEDFAYGFLYAVASENESLIGELFESLIYIYSLYKSLPARVTRYKLSVVDHEASSYQISLLAFCMVRAIKYLRNRPPLVSQSLEPITNQVIELIRWLSNSIQNKVDLVSGYVYDPDPSYYLSLWASIAMGEILSVQYDVSLHETAAKVYLAIQNSNPPADGTPNFRLQSALYIWNKLNNFSVSAQLTYLATATWQNTADILWWVAALSPAELAALAVTKSLNSGGNLVITIPVVGQIVPANLHELSLALLYTPNLVTEPTFYLYAKEAQVYTTYLYQWAVEMWPTGRLWTSELAVESGIVGSLFKAAAATAFTYALQLSILQDSNRIRLLQAEALESYQAKPTLMSDYYWATWLAEEKEKNQLKDKAGHWGIVDLQLSSLSTSVVAAGSLNVEASSTLTLSDLTYYGETYPQYAYMNVWDTPIPYEEKRNPGKETKVFNPNLLQSPNDLFYKKVSVSIQEASTNGYLYKQIQKSTPGFSYVVNADTIYSVNDPLEITVDSDYAVRPLSDFSSQCEFVTGLIYNPIKPLTKPGHVVYVTSYSTKKQLNVTVAANKVSWTLTQDGVCTGQEGDIIYDYNNKCTAMPLVLL